MGKRLHGAWVLHGDVFLHHQKIKVKVEGGDCREMAMPSSPQGVLRLRGYVCKPLRDLGREKRLETTCVGSARGWDGNRAQKILIGICLQEVFQGPLWSWEGNQGVKTRL